MLLGRTLPPSEDRWPALLSDPAAPAPLRYRLEILRELQERGSLVRLREADVADRSSISAALAFARERAGPIDGVVHAAGIADGRLLAGRSAGDMLPCWRQKWPG